LHTDDVAYGHDPIDWADVLLADVVALWLWGEADSRTGVVKASS
jgi:hypothetical protein